MPPNIGYPPGQMSVLARMATARQGIPQPGITPTPTGPQGAVDILAALRGGNVSAEQLIALLALLAGIGPGGAIGGPAPEQPTDIEQAFSQGG